MKSSSQENPPKKTQCHNSPTGKPFKVLYHNDWDGIASAWVVRRALRESAKDFTDAAAPNLQFLSWSEEQTEFIPVQYGFPPPQNLANSDVLIVDFSYKRPQMIEIKEKAKVLLCLDHHSKAENELRGLDYCIFDNSKSGCILAWEYFNSAAKDPPLFLKYVDDRDRWKFKMKHSRELNAVIRSYPMDFDGCDHLHDTFNMMERFSFATVAFKSEGEAIIRYQKRLIESAVSHARPMMIEGHVGLGVNMPLPNMVSDTGEKLCDEIKVCKSNGDDSISARPTFGVCWFHNGKQWVYSLRSRYGFDVAEFAAKLGGGGHKGAAGFQSDNPPWYYEGLYKEASVLQVQESLRTGRVETPLKGGGNFDSLPE